MRAGLPSKGDFKFSRHCPLNHQWSPPPTKRRATTVSWSCCSNTWQTKLAGEAWDSQLIGARANFDGSGFGPWWTIASHTALQNGNTRKLSESSWIRLHASPWIHFPESQNRPPSFEVKRSLARNHELFLRNSLLSTILKNN